MTTPRRVLVLHTGGTLGMAPGPRGLEPVPGQLVRDLRRDPRFHAGPVGGDGPLTLPSGADPARPIVYDVREVAPLLDSSNMTTVEWGGVAAIIAEEEPRYDAFVVIHGTDTMAWAASALSFMLVNLHKTVILTGSQIPFAHLRNDAIDNLLGALVIAGRYDLPEVGLYFSARLYRGTRATKTDAAGLEAFSSPNAPALATVGVDIDVAWEHVRLPSDGPLRVRAIGAPEVAVIALYPGMSAATLERLLAPPLQGAVLQTFGSGNAPDRHPALLRALERATTAGIPVVAVSQCLRGTVRPDYAAGRALADVGVVSGLDMTTEAALTKLAFLLSQDDVPDHEIPRFVQTDLRGELTPLLGPPRMTFKERRFVREVARALGQHHDAAIGRALYPMLLTSAAEHGDLDVIARLLAVGADPGAPSPDGRRPLHAAAAAGHEAVVTWLLARGADPQAQDAAGRTAHRVALDAGHPALARRLATHGDAP